VRQVFEGSPADEAVLEVGDRIVTIDGEPVTDSSKLFALVVTRRPGSEVELEFVRGGQLMTVRAVLVGIEG
jgi:S1-C subfamily serine protease